MNWEKVKWTDPSDLPRERSIDVRKVYRCHGKIKRFIGIKLFVAAKEVAIHEWERRQQPATCKLNLSSANLKEKKRENVDYNFK